MTDFDRLTTELHGERKRGYQEMKIYQERINDRPRKKLNYSTAPADRPNEHLKSIFSTPFVACQTWICA